MLENTLKFYEQFLPDVGFQIDESESHALSKYTRGKKGVSFIPVKADGLPVVLGTKENLNKSGDDNVIYHPLTEDALKGESFTIKITKDQINSMIRMRFVTCLLGLGRALVEKRNAKVTAKQIKLFNQNPDFDEDALATLEAILSKAKNSVVSRHVIGIYLHSKNCKFEGHEVKRLAKVSSSLYNVLDSGEKEIWGVKRVKTESGKTIAVKVSSQKAIKQLMDTILPGLNDDQYTSGSNNKTAPYFDALANAYLNVSYQLDTIESTCKSLFHDELSIKPKYEWVQGLTHLAKLAMPIPALRGNLGNDVIGQAAFDVSPGHKPSIKETDKPTTTTTPQSTTSEPAKAEPENTGHPFFGGGQPQQTTQPLVQQPIQQPVTTPMVTPQAQPQAQGSHPFFGGGGGQPQQPNNVLTNTGMPRNDDGLF